MTKTLREKLDTAREQARLADTSQLDAMVVAVADHLGVTVEALESGAVQAMNGEIESALGCLDDPTGGTHVEDMRRAAAHLRAALAKLKGE